MSTIVPLHLFIWGATALACFAVGLFFVRFWRDAKDRFFALFALAFFVLGLNWVGLAIALPTNETRHFFYLLRLAAFLIIIGAIIDKNRNASRS